MKTITLKNYTAEKCPKCGNDKKFNAFSDRGGADYCNVWVECAICNYDPTNGNSFYRYEDVHGVLTEGTILTALSVWDDLIIEKNEEGTAVSCT